MHGMWLLSSIPSMGLAPPAALPAACMPAPATCPAPRLAFPSMLVEEAPGPLVARNGFRGVTVPTKASEIDAVDPIVDSSTIVEDMSLRTWSYNSPEWEQVQIVLSSLDMDEEIDAEVELWSGPESIMCKMHVYVEDGEFTPFSAMVETPPGPNTIAIRNADRLELPIAAEVVADNVNKAVEPFDPEWIDGDDEYFVAIEPSVDSVQVMLQSEGEPLSARIELVHGVEDNYKQVIEIFSEEGFDYPIYLFIDTPGVDSAVRIVNTALDDFPITASVMPYSFRGDYGGYGGYGGYGYRGFGRRGGFGGGYGYG